MASGEPPREGSKRSDPLGRRSEDVTFDHDESAPDDR
jgi:hypothetical protein